MHISPRAGGAAAIRKVVLHLNAGPETQGGAQGLANYLKTIEGGYHQIVDNLTIVTCAPPEMLVYGASGMNDRGYHICLVGNVQTADEWHDTYSTGELNLAAALVAARCKDFDLPADALTDAEIADPNVRGICDHWGVNRAIVQPAWKRGDHSMGKGDHVDVGPGFPWPEFMADVTKAYNPQDKVKPMHDPPLSMKPWAAEWRDRNSNVIAAVSQDFDVYAFGVPYRPWPTQVKDTAGRKAASIGRYGGPFSKRYIITATSGETYHP